MKAYSIDFSRRAKCAACADIGQPFALYLGVFLCGFHASLSQRAVSLALKALKLEAGGMPVRAMRRLQVADMEGLTLADRSILVRYMAAPALLIYMRELFPYVREVEPEALKITRCRTDLRTEIEARLLEAETVLSVHLQLPDAAG